MAAPFPLRADVSTVAAMAERILAFVDTMRQLDPAIAVAQRAGVVPASSLAADAMAFWMGSQAALGSASVFVTANQTLDSLSALAARNVRLAPHVLSTLMADRARRLGAPPRPAAHFDPALRPGAA